MLSLGLHTALMVVMGCLIGWSLLCTVHHLIVFAAVLRDRKGLSEGDGGFPFFTIVVPAHDEESGIGQTVKSLLELRYPRERYRVVVIADNCTDSTAERARESGASCLVRTDGERKGKGYAVDHAFRLLAEEGMVDAVILVDADSRVDPDLLNAFSRGVRAGARAMQAFNGTSNPEQGWISELMHLSDMVQFHLYFRGRERLGLTCPLLGNGWCFSMELVRSSGWRAFSITENWEQYLRLLAVGERIRYISDAFVASEQVATVKQGRSQRLRWFTGRSRTIRLLMPKVVVSAMARRDLVALEAALAFMMPSLTGFMTLHGISLLAAFFVSPTILVGVSSICLLFWLVVVGAAIHFSAQPGALLRRLPFVPLFIAWKTVLRAIYWLTPAEHRWIRTTRNNATEIQGRRRDEG